MQNAEKAISQQAYSMADPNGALHHRIEGCVLVYFRDTAALQHEGDNAGKIRVHSVFKKKQGSCNPSFDQLC